MTHSAKIFVFLFLFAFLIDFSHCEKLGDEIIVHKVKTGFMRGNVKEIVEEEGTPTDNTGTDDTSAATTAAATTTAATTTAATTTATTTGTGTAGPTDAATTTESSDEIFTETSDPSTTGTTTTATVPPTAAPPTTVAPPVTLPPPPPKDEYIPDSSVKEEIVVSISLSVTSTKEMDNKEQEVMVDSVKKTFIEQFKQQNVVVAYSNLKVIVYLNGTPLPGQRLLDAATHNYTYGIEMRVPTNETTNKLDKIKSAVQTVTKEENAGAVTKSIKKEAENQGVKLNVTVSGVKQETIYVMQTITILMCSDVNPTLSGECPGDIKTNITAIYGDIDLFNYTCNYSAQVVVESEGYLFTIQFSVPEDNLTLAQNITNGFKDNGTSINDFYTNYNVDTNGLGQCEAREKKLNNLTCSYNKQTQTFVVNLSDFTFTPVHSENTSYSPYECDKDITVHVNGTVTVPSKNTTGYVICNIICSATGYFNKSTTIQYKVFANNNPFIDMTKSDFPDRIFLNKPFTSTVYLKYPVPDLGKTEVEIELSKLDGDEELIFKNATASGKDKVVFRDLKVTCEEDANETDITFLYSNTTYGINEPHKTTVSELPVCTNGDIQDEMGFCCPDGSNFLCTLYNIDFHFKYVETEWNDFSFTFLSFLKKDVFNGTPYFPVKESKSGSTISIVIRINTKNGKYDGNRLLNAVESLPTVAGLKQFISTFYEQIISESGDYSDKYQKQLGGFKTSFNLDKPPSISVDTSNTDTPAPSATLPPEEEKTWAEKYWYVILIIVLVIVILIAVLAVGIYILSSKRNEVKAIERRDTFLSSVTPIEQIKKENAVEEKDLYVPYANQVIKEGFLLKEGKGRVLDKFQQRYCVLYFEPAVLRIYESMTPSYYGNIYVHQKQSVGLNCLDNISYESGSNEFIVTFKVDESSFKEFEHGDKERQYHFKIEGENGINECKQWAEAFKNYQNKTVKAEETIFLPRAVIKNDTTGKFSVQSSSIASKKNEEIMNRIAEKRKRQATVIPNKVIRDTPN